MVQPYVTVAVQSHVPMKLELRSSNYTKWSSFQAMCGKFSLLRHIDGTPPPDPCIDTWKEADYCVRSWLYGCVSDSIHDFAMAPDQTAFQLWTAIAAHIQGDLSIEDYSKKMKKAVDALRDVGQPVPEGMLVLNLLRGVDPRFSNTTDFIAATPT
ncbi:uncharacterized protein LOC112892501 [Panicum hallii]|uniref:uncharacterized protein LOC112892501 n=1 Tax=Panicum hallii TaxID=206008 RepID=UPI000DF4E214|nr:uncharacterized protein LOC112892501 [Panicum hallii]